MNEKPLGNFIAYKRRHVNLADYDVPKRSRRTPGLTREEVATMAHVSVDWLARIEQGRTGVSPSADALLDICHALHFDNSEIEYVFNLVHFMPPSELHTEVSSAAVALIDARVPAPAFIMNHQLTVIATNQSFDQLYGSWDEQEPLARNWVWRTFQSQYFRTNLSGWDLYAQYVTAVFRKIYSETPDAEFLYQVYDAIKNDAVFAPVWASLQVSNFKTQHLMLQNPTLGDLYLIENVLEIPGTNQFVVFEDPGDADTLAKLTQLNHRD